MRLLAACGSHLFGTHRVRGNQSQAKGIFCALLHPGVCLLLFRHNLELLLLLDSRMVRKQRLRPSCGRDVTSSRPLDGAWPRIWGDLLQLLLCCVDFCSQVPADFIRN